jgi:hypothetical protein
MNNNNNVCEDPAASPNHFDADSSQRSTPLFIYTKPVQPMRISSIDMKATVKQCSVRLERLPIVFYPSDTESESESETEDLEDLFSVDFAPEASSPIIAPKFYMVSLNFLITDFILMTVNSLFSEAGNSRRYTTKSLTRTHGHYTICLGPKTKGYHLISNVISSNTRGNS